MAAQEVLVVGAGPTGLLLASELARRGVGCTLIDAHDSPLGWDRATIVHSRSMDIFEALGLEDRFLEEGVRSRLVRIRSNGRQIAEMDFGLVDTPYAFDLGISENVTERILTEHLEAVGGQVTRSTRLVGLEQDGERVRATVEREGGDEVVEADWLVGCDGFHSKVRRLAGIEYPGHDIERPWAVFDATLDGWEHDLTVQVAHLDEPAVILTPLPGGRWRVYLRPTSPDSDLVEDAAEVVRRYDPGVTPVDVENAVRFECHSRIAASYREGRVLLAGDAAHACTPAQGHGMNTGIQDAFNLGWKLAHVCRGEAGPGLLDSYGPERRPVAEMVVASGDDFEGAQTLVGAGERAARDEGIAGTFRDPEAARLELVASAELARSYAGSPIVAAATGSGGLAPGDLVPHTAPISVPGGEPRRLHELADADEHTLLVLGGPGADRDAIERVAVDLAAEHGGAPFVGAIRGAVLEEAIAGPLGIDGITILAVRPDRFVGLRTDGEDTAPLGEYLRVLAG
jgi:2-polyprenyl-6-methoxyphenol hydroxylase-like FAD-dependent oxidoreductase